ncbi:MAG TPA: HEAT repeat domain-containing protein [Thermoanaerobaculia bacterium]
MSCDEILAVVTARFADAGELDAPGRGTELPPAVEEHLAACAPCRAEAEELRRLWRGLALLETAAPEGELRERFDAVLAAYQAGIAAAGEDERGGRERGWRRWLAGLAPAGRPRLQLAYGLLVLLVGLGLGLVLAGGGAPLGGEGRGELRALRGEVRALNELVTLSLLEAPSASERLQGVSFGSRMERPDREVLAALVAAATQDPNVNVRLAAIEALAPLASQPRVLDPLARALPEQDSPVVQVALVDLLLASDGEAARRAAASLLDDEAVHPEVRRHVAERLGQRL